MVHNNGTRIIKTVFQFQSLKTNPKPLTVSAGCQLKPCWKAPPAPSSRMLEVPWAESSTTWGPPLIRPSASCPSAKFLQLDAHGAGHLPQLAVWWDRLGAGTVYQGMHSNDLTTDSSNRSSWISCCSLSETWSLLFGLDFQMMSDHSIKNTPIFCLIYMERVFWWELYTHILHNLNVHKIMQHV